MYDNANIPAISDHKAIASGRVEKQGVSVSLAVLMIECRNIYRNYGPLQVLKGVSATIAAGEIVSIVGKSGAGKTTLLHILGTLDRPDEGSIWYDGQDISALDDKAISQFRNQHIGFIFQFHHLLAEFTALENTIIPALLAKTDKAAAEKKATELLAYLGLQDRLTHKPNELSGGEQQRVAIARALINDPKVVLADEPTGNLDTTTSAEIHDLIFRLRDDLGQTFVIVTHNSELAERCDRTLSMADGLILSSDGQAR